MEPWRKHLQALVRGDEAGVVTSLLGERNQGASSSVYCVDTRGL